ncbi:ABC transporter ATP-binding protein, partial [Candidatus Magnetoovum chiemensis]
MIEVYDLWKVFRLYKTPFDKLKETIVRKKRYSRDLIALKGISLKIKGGQSIGIVGENGAGKSTLLKILTGVLIPTKGSFKIDGLITGLLELGTGFNRELSGRKNVYMNGLLIGMSKDEITKKMASIIEFSELGPFIDEPMKTYSSGMAMRLGFSVAIHA